MTHCIKGKPHPLRKHRLFFNQQWWIRETVMLEREETLKSALAEAEKLRDEWLMEYVRLRDTPNESQSNDGATS